MDTLISFQSLRGLLVQTLRDPRGVANHLTGLNLPLRELWICMALVTVLLSLIMSTLFIIAPWEDVAVKLAEIANADPSNLAAGKTVTPDEMYQHLLAGLNTLPAYYSPILFAVLQLISAAVGVYALGIIGQYFGGRGRLADVLVAMVWAQLVLLCLCASLAVIGMVLPLVQMLLLLVGIVWFLWAVISLVDEVHGLSRMGKSAMILLLSFLAQNLVMIAVVSLLGI